MKVAKKCARDKSYCTAMDKMLNYPGEGPRGLNQMDLVTLADGKHRVGGIVYQKNPKDKGILLNLCPWCGANLKWFPRAKPKKALR